jgi:dipeptidyl aminopeptidase/acylaminoacyl peptidase
MVRISPTGKNVALRYTRCEQDIILVRDIATGKRLGVVNVSKMRPNHIYFIDDHRLILKASQHNKSYNFRGRHDISSAFILNVEKNDIRQLLTQGDGIYNGQTGLGRLVGLSPEKQYAYMPAYVGSRNKTSGEPIMTLMKVDLNKKKTPVQVKREAFDAVDFFVDENGEILARERYNNRSNIHRIQALKDNDYHDIYTAETTYSMKNFVGLTPDRKSLVVIVRDEQEQDAYYTMSLADGSFTEPFFVREGADIERVLTDIQRVVYGVQYAGFKPSYAFFDSKLNQKIQAIQAVFPDASMRIIDFTPDWQQIIVYIEGAKSAGKFYLQRDHELLYIASAREEIKPSNINPVEITSYQARDGLNIPVLLTKPNYALASGEKLPAIMLPHGGPESNDKYGFDWPAQYFASRGFCRYSTAI